MAGGAGCGVPCGPCRCSGRALRCPGECRPRSGRRDLILFTLLYNTGARISEALQLRARDVHNDIVLLHGKGRKERRTPLLPPTVKVLRGWITERAGNPDDPLFATSTGRPLSRDAVERRIHIATSKAAAACRSLAEKDVTVHTLRHTAAMRLLHAGVDTTVIALWLGHEQIATTNIYLHADMTMKENAIAKITPQRAESGRYQPPDPVLAFLTSL